MEKILIEVQQLEQVWVSYAVAIPAKTREIAMADLNDKINNGENIFSIFNSVSMNKYENVCSLDEFNIQDTNLDLINLETRYVKVLCEEELYTYETNASPAIIKEASLLANKHVLDNDEKYELFFPFIEQYFDTRELVFKQLQIDEQEDVYNF